VDFSTGRKSSTPPSTKSAWRIEQTIANLKTWRIFHADYRRPLATFADTISAVIGLQFYRIA
jgi:hypothetical protein